MRQELAHTDKGVVDDLHEKGRVDTLGKIGDPIAGAIPQRMTSIRRLYKDREKY